MNRTKVISAISMAAVLLVSAVNIFLFNQNYSAPSNQNESIFQSSAGSSQSESESKSSSSSSSKKSHLAEDIVHRAFDETFAHLVNNCPNDKKKSMESCFNDMYKTMQKGAMYYSGPNSDSNSASSSNSNSNAYVDETHAKNNLIPEKVPAWSSSISNVQHWWFLSLIRDALSRETGGYGPWHVGQSQNPNVSMCMIEKIGIKHWQELFAKLNNDGKKREFRPDGVKGMIELPSTEEDNSSRDDDDDDDDDDSYYPSFVILRDPLDRFLSAYIDKCVGTDRRIAEKHCEPNQIYNMENNNIDNPLIEGFTFDDDVDDADKKKKVMNLNEHKKKTMFAAYVDTMPLKWNLHFLPQSFFCNGLYRFIDKYDFEGMMDTSFYQHLNDLGEHYGGRFEETLKEVFEYSSTDDLSLNATTTTAKKANAGIETKASEKVKQYYTPRSLRKVLEYVSIDYVMLKMEIPKWAEEMLREDEMS